MIRTTLTYVPAVRTISFRSSAAAWTRFVMSGFGPAATAQQLAGQSRADRERTGQAIFRYDTFGDEAFWSGTLRLHEAVATLSPVAALGLGLKVDADALPAALKRQLDVSTRGG